MGLMFVPSIIGSMQNAKFQSEIERVASKSGINPTTVYCSNVELAQICYAEYASVSSSQAKQMLVSSGYVLVDEQYNKDGEISATNQSTKVRVDSEDPDSSQSATLTLKFKDVDVTL